MPEAVEWLRSTGADLPIPVEHPVRRRRAVEPLLWLTATCCGAAVMGFELAGARLLMPAYGMGVEVWAAVIATTLGALAIGYALGGRVADAWPSLTAPALMLLLAGSALAAVQPISSVILSRLEALSFVTGAWCSSAAILGMPLVLLGAVQPMIARLLIHSAERAGTTVGGLMAAGTIGGVAGTAGTALVLLPRIGVGAMLLALAGVVLILSITVLAFTRRWCLVLAATLAAAGSFTWARTAQSAPPTGEATRVLEAVEGIYGRLEVLEHNGARMLACDGIFQTALSAHGLGLQRGMLIRGRDYIELIPYFRPHARTALLIGVGGGLHAQALTLHGIDVQGVEIDPAVVELAAKYFGLDIQVTVSDGRSFVRRSERQFDVIILDAFLGSSVPAHLYTREAFRLAAKRLAPGGVLAVHIISRPRHPATRAMAATLRAALPHMIGIRSGLGDELQHIYLLAGREPFETHALAWAELEVYGFTGEEFFEPPTEEAELLTDDRNRLALISRELVIRHRTQCLAHRRKPSW